MTWAFKSKTKGRRRRPINEAHIQTAHHQRPFSHQAQREHRHSHPTQQFN
ncbi:hypothetical protein Godav_006469 [Gossypium davidsonii]|nr:hypothetical protein [Gossypium davidsonii]